MYQPRFQYTHRIVNSLTSIEKYRVVVDMLPLPVDIERELRQDAKIRMAHFSTRIEGNPLDFEEASQAILGRKDRQGKDAEQEVRNYWNALNFLSVSRKMRVPITEKFIKRLHSLIEVRGAGRRNRESQYRLPTPPGVLFAVYDNRTGRPDYIPPEAKDVPNLMREFVEWLNSKEAELLPPPIKAAIATYQFVTIHPFDDGNGRTARALATYILSVSGYDLKGFNSMEEFYVDDLQGYYANLQMGLPVLYYEGRANPQDLAPWIDYFVSIMERAFCKVADIARSRYEEQIDPRVRGLDPREKIVLRLVIRKGEPITPKEISQAFGVPSRTVIDWAKGWMEKGLLEPASGQERVRSYKLGSVYEGITLTDLGYKE